MQKGWINLTVHEIKTLLVTLNKIVKTNCNWNYSYFTTLESGINVAPCINVASVKFD